jgi:hypothetical protein
MRVGAGMVGRMRVGIYVDAYATFMASVAVWEEKGSDVNVASHLPNPVGRYSRPDEW